ncbi:bifunctional 4-hydroxy-2-oxoglutarate aldolase/2-dehydro-3-deoxy-phosphogluconate aldolase [Halopenitus sp. H-Gu1]|uniref:bifunctional 4-hydroxy-2-oxoglutarate aldolase/2-dehydro-3-deoxy-phosphogluconate aldolase n=1 Tax=Halopenitus sp. H-Gu1 TaxID=3242697 RepID=UPI00359CF519
MARKQEVAEKLEESGVVAVLRDIPADQIVEVAEAIHEGGVTALEITADADQYAEMIAAVDDQLADTDAVVGAGTVLDVPTARNAIEAGAEFVLAPDSQEPVIEVCNDEEVVAVPGIMTPTEAVNAMNAGADMLKLFPASTVGPGHIGALHGPLGDVPVMPTGGVSVDNVADYFAAGAVAVGAGSALVNYEAIDAGDMDGVRERAREFVQAVEAARSA